MTSARIDVTKASPTAGSPRYELVRTSPTGAELIFQDSTVTHNPPKGDGLVGQVHVVKDGKARRFAYSMRSPAESYVEPVDDGVRVVFKKAGGASTAGDLSTDPLLGKNVGRITGTSSVAMIPSNVPRYRLRAITFTSAAIEDQSTHAVYNVGINDELPGMGKVTEINPEAASVKTMKGVILASAAK